MTSALPTNSFSTRFILIFLSLALTFMVAALLKARFTNPSLTITNNANEMLFEADQDTIHQGMDEISALMQSVAKNPTDTKC